LVWLKTCGILVQEEKLEIQSASLKVAAALMKAQEKFDPILKDTANPFYKSKYATLDQVIAATRPHLRAQNLIILQRNLQEGDRYGIETRLLHTESGEELYSKLVAKPKEDTIQQIAGVLTYCRRYEYHTITGTASEDDDGNAASGKTEPEERRPQSVQPKPVQTFPVKANIPPFPSTTTSTVPNAVPNAIGGDSSHDLKSPALTGPPQSTSSAVTSTESTSSTGPNDIPDQAGYNAYIERAIKLTEDLQKAGLTNGRGLPAKSKLKKYICQTTGCADIKELTNSKWDALFGGLDTLMTTPEGTKDAVERIEAASAKESK
jgi:ERF superfamily protein